MRVLLIGNFLPQGQHSMLQFEDHLLTGLKKRGVAVTCLRPSPFFSRLGTRSRLVWKWLTYLDKFILFPLRLAMRQSTPNEILHICDHSNAIYLSFLQTQRCLVTCHDLLAVRSARGEFRVHRTGWTGRILQRWVVCGLRRARRLLCDSQATRSDVLRIIGPTPPSQIINIGIAEAYFAETQLIRQGFSGVGTLATERRPVRRSLSESQTTGQSWNAERRTPNAERRTDLPALPFLLHVGGTQWYKNRSGVRQIYRRLRERTGEAAPCLLIVGEADNAAPQIGEQLLSDLSVTELAECYRRAALLLFPSYAEGFGLPIIEAQASGCLVVTTGLPPMNDTGGDAAFYVADPEDVEGFVDAVQRVLGLDAAEAERRRRFGYQNAERFCTDAMITDYLRVYQELAG
jgi:glycosyltransferase involved in cell wall biosynthesis